LAISKHCAVEAVERAHHDIEGHFLVEKVLFGCLEEYMGKMREWANIKWAT
jgi:hypothetical protein